MKALGYLVASVFALAASAAMAAPKSTSIIACYNKETGRARIVHSAAECRFDENSITWNIDGPAGPAGAQGPAGPMGLPGPAGAKGATGASGPAGPAGAKGASGQAGPIGPAGPAGANGAIGPVGPAGAMGVAGPIGPAGPQGAAGAMGAVGPAGAMGAAGPIGPAGPQGAAGVAGPIGPAGAMGVAGPTGPAGPEGPPGATGPSGTSGIFGSNIISFFTEGNGGVECTLGSIILNASVVYTSNYLPADGRILPIQTNTALFSILGTNYGGNGTSNFAVPDLRSAAPNNTQYLICVQGVFP